MRRQQLTFFFFQTWLLLIFPQISITLTLSRPQTLPYLTTTTLSNPTNLTNNDPSLDWHCYTWDPSYPDLETINCIPALAAARADLQKHPPAWLSPSPGIYRAYPAKNGKCVIEIGCKVPMVQGGFHVGDVFNKLEFLRVVCREKGGESYLWSPGVEKKMGWYVRVYNQDRPLGSEGYEKMGQGEVETA